MSSLPEHYGCTTTGTANNPFAATRTIRTNAFIRFMVWQNNYHSTHHAFPAVPAHNVQRAHQLVADRTTHTSTGYLRFHLTTIRDLAVRPR